MCGKRAKTCVRRNHMVSPCGPEAGVFHLSFRSQAVKEMPPKHVPGVPYRDVTYYAARGFTVPTPMPTFDLPVKSFDTSLPGMVPSPELLALKVFLDNTSERIAYFSANVPCIDLNSAYDGAAWAHHQRWHEELDDLYRTVRGARQAFYDAHEREWLAHLERLPIGVGVGDSLSTHLANDVYSVGNSFYFK